MNHAINLSRELNKYIKESDIYKDYLRCKQKLQERPDLLKSLQDFKCKILPLQNDEGLDNPYNEVNNLFMEYDGLLHDTIVNDFLKAEQKLCRMMRSVYEGIAEDLEIDMI